MDLNPRRLSLHVCVGIAFRYWKRIRYATWLRGWLAQTEYPLFASFSYEIVLIYYRDIVYFAVPYLSCLPVLCEAPSCWDYIAVFGRIMFGPSHELVLP